MSKILYYTIYYTILYYTILVKLRLHNRFIYVGVDISIYVLLAGGRSSCPPALVKLLYSCGYSGSLVIVIGVCVWISLGTAMCCMGR